MTNLIKYKHGKSIQSLFPYHPKYSSWLKIPNHRHNGWSAQIARIGDRDENAINRMAVSLEAALPDADVICTMPSRNKSDHESGIRKVGALIAGMKKITDATTCLNYISQNKVHLGLMVDHVDLIRGKRVILLDDITRTGRALISGAEVLEAAGANSVIIFALGEAVYET